jgi:hypothetical protein
MKAAASVWRASVRLFLGRVLGDSFVVEPVADVDPPIARKARRATSVRIMAGLAGGSWLDRLRFPVSGGKVCGDVERWNETKRGKNLC